MEEGFNNIMKKTLLVLSLLAAGFVSTAQASEDNPWMLRVRAVDAIFQNGQSGIASTSNITAQNKVLPEVDVSYFFTKNIAAELDLSYPQKVNLNAGSTNIGNVSALPPSLIAQYHITEFGDFKPYVGAGINYTIFGNRQNFPALGNSVRVDQHSVGFVGQVGADYMLDKNWGLNVDLKYITMATNITSVQTGANLGKLTLNPWVPAVGVTYKF